MIRRVWGGLAPAAGVLPLVAALALTACSRADEPAAVARVVENRADLIGGSRALGDLGDFLIENDQVRVVIQGPGFSRGFGVYGGSLIDADLRRPTEWGTDSRAGQGFDAFGELFPAFFLQAVAVDEVVIDNDGKDGKPARVIARGNAGDFLELAQVLNQAVVQALPDDNLSTIINDEKRKAFLERKALAYENIYELAPGARHVKITLRVTNTTDQDMAFPSGLAKTALTAFGIETDGFTVPLGDVALYGKTSEVFLPGAGFDLRFGLEDSYARGIELPAFPGIVTEWVASRGREISYGLMVPESERNYAYNKREIYADENTPVTPSSLLIPFVAGGFFGVFYEEAPEALPAGESFEMTRYFVIGAGDVGSVLDEMHRIRGVETGTLSGQVFEEVGGQPAEGVSVLLYQRSEAGRRRLYSQYDVRPGGSFTGTLEPGNYSLRVTGEGRPLSDYVDVVITAGQATTVQPVALSPGRVMVNIVNADGARAPGKATAVGVYGAAFTGQETRSFLFDLPAGEAFRSSDLVPDRADDPQTRRYVEGTAFAREGVAELWVRPGKYTIHTSRGPEFDVVTEEITVGPGQTVSLGHAPKRVVDTTGWIAADLHLHSVNSIDSGMSLDQRVLSIAAEGVEYAVSTDHNFVTDYAPVIQRTGLNDFMTSSVGLELTTLESGHFNGYPLDYEVGQVGHGSFEWARRTPDQLFSDLRALGRYGPENTIVQVNHARDTILGYFGQYDRSGFTMDELVSSGLTAAFTQLTGPAFRTEEGDTTFSLAFDALEILNGKLFWEIHHYRVPETLPEGELPEEVPPAGSILVDADGEPAFPGIVDDWYNLLNLGHRFVGVGTSDSHSGDDEAGYFRTLVHVGADDPRAVKELDFVQGLKGRKAVATNGPMLDLHINGAANGIGAELVDGDGEVELTWRLSAAPWVGVARVNVVRNGIIIDVLPVPAGQDLAAQPFTGTKTYPLARGEGGEAIDSWFVLQAVGTDSMFPVVRPLELPPLVLTDAISSLAGPLGFGDAEFGALRPAEIFPVTAYALTNPIWVKTAAGRDFEAPGVVPVMLLNEASNDSGLNNNPRVMNGSITDPQLLERLAGVRPIGRASVVKKAPQRLFARDKNNEYDVRRLFTAFGHTFH